MYHPTTNIITKSNSTRSTTMNGSINTSISTISSTNIGGAHISQNLITTINRTRKHPTTVRIPGDHLPLNLSHTEIHHPKPTLGLGFRQTRC
jgi:hypothetical protein